jgi:hypothetical protein
MGNFDNGEVGFEDVVGGDVKKDDVPESKGENEAIATTPGNEFNVSSLAHAETSRA